MWFQKIFNKSKVEQYFEDLNRANSVPVSYTHLDCSSLGYSDVELNDKILNEAKLWLDGGSMFGKEGENFQRINIACPRSVLKDALIRFKQVLSMN